MGRWGKQETRRKDLKRDQNKQRSKRGWDSRPPLNKIRRVITQYMQDVIRDTVTTTGLAIRKTVERMAAEIASKDGLHLSSSQDKMQDHTSMYANADNRKMKENQTSQFSDSIPLLVRTAEAETSGIHNDELKEDGAYQDILDVLARRIVDQINNPHDTAKTLRINSCDNEKDLISHISSNSETLDKTIFVGNRVPSNAETELDTDVKFVSRSSNCNKNLQHSSTLKRKLNPKIDGNIEKQNKNIIKSCKNTQFENNTVIFPCRDINSNIIIDHSEAAVVSSPSLKIHQNNQEFKTTSVSQNNEQQSNFSYDSAFEYLSKIGTCIRPSVLIDATLDDTPQMENLKLAKDSLINVEREKDTSKKPLQTCEKNNENVILRSNYFPEISYNDCLQNANLKQSEEQNKSTLIQSNRLLKASPISTRVDIDLETMVYNNNAEITKTILSHPKLQNFPINENNEQQKPKLKISHKYQQNANFTHFSNFYALEKISHTRNTIGPSRTWYLPPEPTTSISVNEPTKYKQNLPHEIDPNQAPIPVMVCQMQRNNNYNNIRKQQPVLGTHKASKARFRKKCDKTIPSAYYSSIIGCECNKQLIVQNQISKSPNNSFNTNLYEQTNTQVDLETFRNRVHQHTSSQKSINFLYNSAENEKISENVETIHLNTTSQLGKQQYNQKNIVSSKIISQPTSNNLCIPTPQSKSTSLFTNVIPSERSEKEYTNVTSATQITTDVQRCTNSKRCSNEDQTIQENFHQTLISLGLANPPSEETIFSSSKAITEPTNLSKSAINIKGNSVPVPDMAVKNNSPNNLSSPISVGKSQKFTNLTGNSNCSKREILRNANGQVPAPPGPDASQTPYNLSPSKNPTNPAPAGPDESQTLHNLSRSKNPTNPAPPGPDESQTPHNLSQSKNPTNPAPPGPETSQTLHNLSRSKNSTNPAPPGPDESQTLHNLSRSKKPTNPAPPGPDESQTLHNLSRSKNPTNPAPPGPEASQTLHNLSRSKNSTNPAPPGPDASQMLHNLSRSKNPSNPAPPGPDAFQTLHNLSRGENSTKPAPPGQNASQTLYNLSRSKNPTNPAPPRLDASQTLYNLSRSKNPAPQGPDASQMLYNLSRSQNPAPPGPDASQTLYNLSPSKNPTNAAPPGPDASPTLYNLSLSKNPTNPAPPRLDASQTLYNLSRSKNPAPPGPDSSQTLYNSKNPTNPAPPGPHASQTLCNVSRNINPTNPVVGLDMPSYLLTYTIDDDSQNELSVPGCNLSSISPNGNGQSAINLSRNSLNKLTVSTNETYKKQISSLSIKTKSSLTPATPPSSNRKGNEVLHNNAIKANIASKQSSLSNRHHEVMKLLGHHVQEQPSTHNEISSNPETLHKPLELLSCNSRNNSQQNLRISSKSSSVSTASPKNPCSNIIRRSETLLETQKENPKPELTSNPGKLHQFTSANSLMPILSNCSPTNISQQHLDAYGTKLTYSSITVTSTIPPKVTTSGLKLRTDIIIESLKNPTPLKPNSTKPISGSSNLSGSSTQYRYNPLSISKTARNILRKKSLEKPLPSGIENKLHIVNESPVTGFGVKVNRLRPFKP